MREKSVFIMPLGILAHQFTLQCFTVNQIQFCIPAPDLCLYEVKTEITEKTFPWKFLEPSVRSLKLLNTVINELTQILLEMGRL